MKQNIFDAYVKQVTDLFDISENEIFEKSKGEMLWMLDT